MIAPKAIKILSQNLFIPIFSELNVELLTICTMWAKPTHFLLIAIWSVLAFACGSGKSVKLIDTNFGAEVRDQQNLNFVFDRPLVGDTVLNVWDETKYLKIEPEISGMFKWSSESVLIFSPAEPFAPATKYTILLTNELTKGSGLSLGGDKSISFSTPLLETEIINTFWSDVDETTVAHLDIFFNHPVEASVIGNELQVVVDGNQRSFELIEDANDKNIKLFIPDVTVEDKDFEIEVTMPKGLKPKGGNLGSQDEVFRALTLRSPYQVRIEDITAQHNGAEGVLDIEISQQASADAKKFITIRPNVTFEVGETESGLKVKSEDFDVRKKYTVVLQKGLKGKYGGSLKRDFSEEVSFGKVRPEIKFARRNAFYLGGDGQKNLEVKIVSVDKVKISVTKLYENNFKAFTNETSYNYNLDEYTYDYYNLSSFGDVIWNQEVEVKSLAKSGGYRILNLDIEDELSKYNGVYVVQVMSDEEYWLRDYQMVAVSDIGLVAKEGKKNVTVFANSIKNAQPIGQVELNFFGRNNQLIGAATTDANGVAILEKNENLPNGFDLSMITAKTADDYNLMSFDKTGVNTYKFDVDGRYPNSAGLDVFVYGDRDMYRPGETVYLSGVVRTEAWQTPESFPVIVKIRNPQGKEYRTFKKVLNQHGSFEISMDLSASAATGSYSAQVFTSNDIFLASKNIKVEEFMPDRIKLDVDVDRNEIELDETAQVTVVATNFFGPPAAGRNYEINVSTKRKYFYSRDFAEYNFNIEKADGYFRDRLTEGTTDDQGGVSYVYEPDPDFANMGLLQADVFVTVFDETGRPVNQRESITVSTQDTYYGIATDRYYTATNSEMKFGIIALDKNRKVKSNEETRLRIIKHDYKSVLSRSGGYFRYRSQPFERVIEDKDIQISGEDEFYAFTPEESGRYEIRLSKPGVNTYVNQTIYAYGWGTTSGTSFEIDPEGQIDIQLDQDAYEVGQTANVILKSPFSGKILVTVETDKILKHFYVETDQRATSFALPIEDHFVPNVYITATLFKPHAESDLPLTIAHGISPIKVENPKLKMPLAIEAPTKSRSKTKQTIKVQGIPNSAVTLAVVDEGILQLTRYQTPDPYTFFYRKRALGVESYDIYPFLFPEINLQSGRIGGGAALDAELNKRINPLTNERVKLVSFWSGILETDGSGEAQFEIDIPQFSGSLRVMAAGYKDNTFASASSNIQVADPIVISAALPRFLSPGDTTIMPVMISNTTDKPTSAKTDISVEGSIELVGSGNEKVQVAANSEAQVTFKLVAKKEIGNSKVMIDVDALGETFKHDTDLTVRPSGPLQKAAGNGSVKGGESQTVVITGEQFIPQSVQRKLVLSNSPLIEFTKDLDYLVRYPYGCVEQTTSAVFPQLYFNDLAKAVLTNKAEANTAQNIIAAIHKLQAMQLYHGGLTYWPGGGYESWWGSVYAAHFLYEAQKAGYEVDQTMFNKLLDYLATKLKSRETTYYYYNNTQRQIARREIPYSLYVLALAGKPKKSTMNYYKNNLKDLSLDSRYMLAAAYSLIGDDRKYREVLPAEFSGERARRSFGGSFSSYVRDEAIALNTLLEVDPDNPQVDVMARHLSQYLRTERYLNTQERVFSFLALGKIARRNAENKVKATITAGGKTLGSYDNKTLTLNTDQLEDGTIEINAEGNGSLYYFWQAEGLTADGSFKEVDSYLKVRKTFYDRNGRVITSNRFEQNDLIVIKLDINSSNRQSIDNVAITDLLPAGFEIENPRIADLADMNWIKDNMRPDYMDVRDDRIMFFTNLGGYEESYYYMVRAVTKGTFQMGPASADAMYNGEYHSYNGGGTIIVE